MGVPIGARKDDTTEVIILMRLTYFVPWLAARSRGPFCDPPFPGWKTLRIGGLACHEEDATVW